MYTTVYSPRFRSWFLSTLSVTESTMVFQLYGCLICPYHIRKVRIEVLLAPGRSFLFINLSDQLAVCRATECPTKLPSTAKNSGTRDPNSIHVKRVAKLRSCSLIILLHFFFNQIFHSLSNFGRLSRARLSTETTSLPNSVK